MQQPSIQQPSAQRGVTFVELLCVMTIIGVLCAVSTPALGSLIADGQSRSAHNNLIAALNLARNSAVARGAEIVLCPSSDGNRCDASPWWQHGWIVFADRDRNGSRNGDEPLLAATQALPGVAIASSSGREHVTYRADGSATGTNLTLTLCDRRGAKFANAIIVNNAGRARLAPATPAQAATACAGLAST